MPMVAEAVEAQPMSALSRNKGARGEREWAAFLSALGFDAHRGQQRHGGPDSPDVRGGIPGTHAEVKRVEKLNIWQAMEQAQAEAPEGDIPYVAHRRNRSPWLVTLRASDLERLARKLEMTDG